MPRGFSFSWKWWNQKRKKKATKYGERGNECFFLHPTKQPTRSGQWTLSSSYDFSAASCYKSDHPRYENDTAERDKLYRKVYSLVVTREPTAKTPIHPEMLSLRRRPYTDSFRERSRDFSFFVYVFARLSSYMIGREVWRAPCTTQPNKRNGFPATHRCSPFGTHLTLTSFFFRVKKIWCDRRCFSTTTDRTIVLYLCPFFSLGWSCWLQAKFIRSSSSSSLDITRVQWRDPLCGPGEDVLLAEGTANWAGFWSGSNRVKRWKLSQPSVVFSRPLLWTYGGEISLYNTLKNISSIHADVKGHPEM